MIVGTPAEQKGNGPGTRAPHLATMPQVESLRLIHDAVKRVIGAGMPIMDILGILRAEQRLLEDMVGPQWQELVIEKPAVAVASPQQTAAINAARPS